MKKSLFRRLERIEIFVAAKLERQEVTVEQRDMREMEMRLLERTNPPYKDILAAELEVPADENGTRHAPSALLIAFSDVIYEHIKHGRPLELPDAVATVYLSEPEANASHDCEDCGYALPLLRARPFDDPPRRGKIYFARCPLCGGRVGHGAFSERQNRERQYNGTR
jgi:hypothetical protein